MWLSQIIASCQCHSPSYIEPSEAPYILTLSRCTLQRYHVYSLVARVTQFLCSTAHKNSPGGIHSYPTRSRHPYSSEARPHSSRRLKWAKGERLPPPLPPQRSFDNCFAVFNFSQPSYLHSAPHILTLESLEGEKQTALTAKPTSDHQKLSPLLSTIVKGSHTAPGGLFYISAEAQLSSLLWTHWGTKMCTLLWNVLVAFYITYS